MFKQTPGEASACLNHESHIMSACPDDDRSNSRGSGDQVSVKKRLLLYDDQTRRHNKRLMSNHDLSVHGNRNSMSRAGLSNTSDKGYNNHCYSDGIASPFERSDSSSKLQQLDEDLSTKSKSKNNEFGGGCEQDPSPGKHLVKTLSDLPKFVTIEGYRVASYTIDGEPYLCLPHLLQYIQQKHPLDKVIETFERTVASFNSATPKQVEGFIKAIVLPPGATGCPLIRRSDAERVCLALYDQNDDHDDDESNGKVKKSGGANAGSHLGIHQIEAHLKEKINEPQNLKLRHTSDQILNNQDAHKSHPGNLNHQPQSSARHDTSKGSLCGRSSSTSGGEEALSKGYTIQEEFEPHKLEKQAQSVSEKNSPTSQDAPNRKLPVRRRSDGPGCSQLFGTEDQDAFLNFARAATSMLRIKVYHRCFGKCTGFYYPSLREEVKCIECSECHRMFSPRRFIGHTHKSKEENVCHWGFNSYLWRHYIYLCKNQDINQLDEDELLVQLKALKAIPERDQCETEARAAELDNDGDDDDGKSNVVIEHKKTSFMERVRDQPYEAPITSASNVIPCAPSDRRLVTSHSSHPINVVKPTIFENSSNACGMASTLRLSGNSTHDSHKSDQHRNPVNWSLMQPMTPSMLDSLKISIDPNTHITSTSSNTLQFPLNSLLSNPLLFSPHYKSFPASSQMSLGDFNLPQLGGLLGPTKRNGQFDRQIPSSSAALLGVGYQRASTSDELMKQDMFVSSSMAAYLSSRCLSSDLIRDIIEHTLDAISKSRMMF